MGAAGSVAGLASDVLHIRGLVHADESAGTSEPSRVATQTVGIFQLGALQRIEGAGVRHALPRPVVLDVTQPTLVGAHVLRVLGRPRRINDKHSPGDHRKRQQRRDKRPVPLHVHPPSEAPERPVRTQLRRAY